MNIKVFDKPAPRALAVKLFERGTSHVELYAVDNHSGGKLECGRILSIGPHGIERALEVNQDAGLPLDAAGRVKLDGEPQMAAVLELIKPFAEYAAKRDKCKPFTQDAFAFCSILERPDVYVTVGQLRALAAFYEANK